MRKDKLLEVVSLTVALVVSTMITGCGDINTVENQSNIEVEQELDAVENLGDIKFKVNNIVQGDTNTTLTVEVPTGWNYNLSVNNSTLGNFTGDTMKEIRLQDLSVGEHNLNIKVSKIDTKKDIKEVERVVSKDITYRVVPVEQAKSHENIQISLVDTVVTSARGTLKLNITTQTPETSYELFATNKYLGSFKGSQTLTVDIPASTVGNHNLKIRLVTNDIETERTLSYAVV